MLTPPLLLVLQAVTVTVWKIERFLRGAVGLLSVRARRLKLASSIDYPRIEIPLAALSPIDLLQVTGGGGRSVLAVGAGGRFWAAGACSLLGCGRC